MSLVPVPSLDELAAHPERARELLPKVAWDLLIRVIALQTVLLTRILSTPAGGNGHAEAPKQDRLAQTAVPMELPDPDSRAAREPMPDARPHMARTSLLSVKEAARILSCSEAAVRKWAYQRRLPAVKVGRLTRFHLADVEALIARGSRPARADRR